MSGLTLGGPELTFKDLLLNRLDYLGKASHIEVIYDFDKFLEIVKKDFGELPLHSDKSVIFDTSDPDHVFFKVIKARFCSFDDDLLLCEKIPFTETIFKEYFEERTTLLCREEVNKQLEIEKKQEWQNKITARMKEEELI